MTNNPYDALGVSKNASIDEIKSQFRRLALRLHPDKSNSKYAVENFKEISEAYEILSDPIKREAYDKKVGQNEEHKNTYQTGSVSSIWWRQLKTMGRELLRLLKKYAQSMNEKQNHYQSTKKSGHSESSGNKINDFIGSIFGDSESDNREYDSRKYDNFSGKMFGDKKTKIWSDEYDDSWTSSGKNDAKLVNGIFGVKKPKQKRKQENLEDPWINASEEDSRLANDIFGVEQPRKKRKDRRNYDCGFNMEDVFDLWRKFHVQSWGVIKWVMRNPSLHM